jgi:hypothetical protein
MSQEQEQPLTAQEAFDKTMESHSKLLSRALSQINKSIKEATEETKFSYQLTTDPKLHDSLYEYYTKYGYIVQRIGNRATKISWNIDNANEPCPSNTAKFNGFTISSNMPINVVECNGPPTGWPNDWFQPKGSKPPGQFIYHGTEFNEK